MLQNLAVLIVEDEPLTAMELADAVTARGGTVLGPAGSISSALTILAHETPDAAILEAMLPDDDASPIGDILAAGRVPYVVYTGSGIPDGLAAVERMPRVVMKPAPPSAVLDALEAELRRGWDTP